MGWWTTVQTPTPRWCGINPQFPFQSQNRMEENGEEDHGVDDSNQLLEKTNHSHMIMSLQCNHFSLSGGLED
jgi:hypothetical protein